jgi:peptide/nickel transport system substrate-binding protein
MSTLSRREFIRISTLVAASSVAAACVAPSAPAEPAAPTSPAAEPASGGAAAPAAPASRFAESPLLAEQVQAGTLPPVEERLPEDAMLVGPGVLCPAENVDWQPGRFGGTLRMATARTDLCAELWDASAEPPLMAAGKLRVGSVAEVTPNVLSAYEISEDLLTITFHMRKGLKWSDGTPCTTADVLFWYEDVLKNEEITPTPGKIYKSGNRVDGTLMDLEVVDDYTFRVLFDEPGLALVANWSTYSQVWSAFMRPAHYMKQFHKKYADADELNALLAEANIPAEEWWRYYLQRDEGTQTWTLLRCADPAYPTLAPWILETESSGLKTYVRNPYYWKVDTEGQQLPYIDRIRVEILSNSEAVTMKILAGEVDWAREYASMVNLPLYKENEERSGFRTMTLPTFTAPLQMRFNYTNPDPVWRETVRDVRFRKALNMAINHMQIVDIVYNGFAAEPDIIGLPYDPDGANALLDEMGMDQRDGEGFRLGIDGQPFTFPLEVRQGYTPEQDALCELLVEYWQDVGIRTDFRNIENTLYEARHNANELYVNMSWAHTGFWRNSPTYNDYVPDASRLWGLWVASGGTEGEEPDLPWAARLFEIAAQADAYVMTDADTKALHEEMFEILRTEVPTVLPIDHTVGTLIGSVKLANIPHDGIVTLASFTQEQFYYNE